MTLISASLQERARPPRGLGSTTLHSTAKIPALSRGRGEKAPVFCFLNSFVHSMKMAASLETTGSPPLTSPLMKKSFLFAGQELWFATSYANEGCGVPSLIWLRASPRGESDPRHPSAFPN